MRPSANAAATARAGLLLAAVLGVPACGPAVEPAPERFAMVAINGAPLPGSYPDPQGCCAHLEVIEGELVLEADGSLLHTLRVRCRTSLPAGTTCEVSGDGRETTAGRYSRSEGTVTLGQGPPLPAAFGTDRLVVTVQLPPSTGYYPTFILEYGSR